MFISVLKWLAGWEKKPQTKQIKKKTNNIKQEFLKYPSNTTSFTARFVSNFSPQQTHLHRHKLTHAAWPLHWLSLKIKKLLSPHTWLSPLPSFRQDAEKEGGPYVSVQGCKGLGKTVSLGSSKRICHTCLPATARVLRPVTSNLSTIHFRPVNKLFCNSFGSWLKEQALGWISQVRDINIL